MQTITWIIDRARPADLGPICALLAANDLPTNGVAEALGYTLVARSGEEVAGCVALEVYGPYALLRSLAVAESKRGKGLGMQLSRALLELAAQLSITQLYLLTETAANFFPRLGFRPVDRSRIPAEVLEAEEFTTLCPVSALAMVVDLPHA
jgi:amino-acid N-acetyltransferase